MITETIMPPVEIKYFDTENRCSPKCDFLDINSLTGPDKVTATCILFNISLKDPGRKRWVRCKECIEGTDYKTNGSYNSEVAFLLRLPREIRRKICILIDYQIAEGKHNNSRMKDSYKRSAWDALGKADKSKPLEECPEYQYYHGKMEGFYFAETELEQLQGRLQRTLLDSTPEQFEKEAKK